MSYLLYWPVLALLTKGQQLLRETDSGVSSLHCHDPPLAPLPVSSSWSETRPPPPLTGELNRGNVSMQFLSSKQHTLYIPTLSLNFHSAHWLILLHHVLLEPAVHHDGICAWWSGLLSIPSLTVGFVVSPADVLSNSGVAAHLTHKTGYLAKRSESNQILIKAAIQTNIWFSTPQSHLL